MTAVVAVSIGWLVEARGSDSIRYRAVLVWTCEPKRWRCLLDAEKECEVAEGNSGSNRSWLQVARVDFGPSCAECTEKRNKTRTGSSGLNSCVCERLGRERP